MRHSHLLLALVLATLLAGAALPLQAQQPCRFVLGFATLRQLIGAAIVGDCLEDERHNPTSGDAEQRTTGGLLVWRKADNWTGFTDGHLTWVNGPLGLQQRRNWERLPWESDAPAVPHPPRPAGLVAVPVLDVVDGDTLDVLLGGRRTRLRLIGINTPEVVDPRRPVQCFGREASARAHELLDGQTIWLEADASQGERDAFGRLLRYVWLPDGRLFNLQMVAEGYAREFTFRLPYRYQALFREAERQARERGLGLWAPETCAGNTMQPAPVQVPVPG
jgi:micrococcal nuclease